MITFEGLLVPSITIVFPFGGADVSGVVMLMDVASDLYCVSAAAAADVELEPDDAALVELEPEDPAEPDGAVELEEQDEPQAARVTASPSVPMIATSPSGRPPLRRSSLVMCVSLAM